MYDKSLVLEVLNRLHETTGTILQRFQPVHSVEDFTKPAEGMENSGMSQEET